MKICINFTRTPPPPGYSCFIYVRKLYPTAPYQLCSVHAYRVSSAKFDETRMIIEKSTTKTFFSKMARLREDFKIVFFHFGFAWQIYFFEDAKAK